ncbi:uncharacterized protein TRAVEDRAFT_113031 [Trametes versicolor FP-101664 SS1]|uniref:uncharacterized protein n=1 Tax=Trametes versicolor (strain FP-101664) TaxID=717944 RepID=UPI00046219E9|nr:uncharacterized protein TRAVEDRAFT_113031 [Trametes versicolor FP-101664 SS1]EIW62470.1 hypothetical protein TRAVEDRAFT_113031 [Trametes versicolor FP-101664 SS1]
MAGGFGDRLARGVTFWGTVGAVMTALKLKEQHDNYSSLPDDEEGFNHGPVALQNPNLDEEAADGASLLDTSLQNGRPKRQRKADCCMCCGLRCGLFWKAFGVVLLLFLGYQAIKLAIWAAKPKLTGLEGMPEFSTSLGCADARFLYNGTKMDIHVPVGSHKDDHSLDVRGGALGTIILAQGSPDLTSVRYELTLRSDTPSLFKDVVLDYPAPDEMEDNMRSSRLQLSTPGLLGLGCMRFDMTIYLPQNLRTLHVQAHALSQIKFDEDSNFDLDKLSVSMYKLDQRSMLLPTEGMHARTMKMQITRGWLVGAVTAGDEVTLMTQTGDATLNVHVHPAPSSAEPPAPVRLLTSTGAGRTDVVWASHAAGLSHRPIDATHHMSMGGAAYLTYKDSGFNGTVDLTAKSFTATGLQAAFEKEGLLPYVGSRAGVDRMLVKAQGWVGLYF